MGRGTGGVGRGRCGVGVGGLVGRGEVVRTGVG